MIRSWVNFQLGKRVLEGDNTNPVEEEPMAGCLEGELLRGPERLFGRSDSMSTLSRGRIKDRPGGRRSSSDTSVSEP